MFKILKFVCFCTILFANDGFASPFNFNQHNLAKMSCRDLIFNLINHSSFKDNFRNLSLFYGFERHDEKYIGIVFATGMENNRKGVYANLQLDLFNNTLNFIDNDVPIPVKIDKNYIPFIKSKCTPEENLYLRTGKLPEEGYD